MIVRAAVPDITGGGVPRAETPPDLPDPRHPTAPVSDVGTRALWCETDPRSSIRDVAAICGILATGIDPNVANMRRVMP